jgi:hypothetical protein
LWDRIVAANLPSVALKYISARRVIMNGSDAGLWRPNWIRVPADGLWNIPGIVCLPFLSHRPSADPEILVIFGRPAQSCPDIRECYCAVYSKCNLTDYELKNQWIWRGLVLPDGWPETRG